MNQPSLPGTCLLWRESGSTSYNLNTGESDVDYQGVYVLPTEALLGLERPNETVVGDWPNDFTAHEIGKFLRLVLKGNPTVTENILAVKRSVDYASGPLSELQANVERLVSANTIRSYLGYAYGQLHKMEIKDNGLHSKGGRYNEKYGMHLIRLLLNARQLAKGEPVTVWWPEESIDRTTLMGIRNGYSSKDEVVATANRLAEEIDALKPWPVREEPDYEWVNNWLVALRKNH